jgi:hypothetical protein
LKLIFWCGRFLRDLVLGVVGLAVFMLLMTAVYVVHQGNINYAVEMLWQELQQGHSQLPVIALTVSRSLPKTRA